MEAVIAVEISIIVASCEEREVGGDLILSRVLSIIESRSLGKEFVVL